MIQACSRTSESTVRLYLADQWCGMVVLSGLSLVLMLGCGFTPTRALGIPGAASRTPDLSLPLQAADRNLALLYLDKKNPPRGRPSSRPLRPASGRDGVGVSRQASDTYRDRARSPGSAGGSGGDRGRRLAVSG